MGKRIADPRNKHVTTKLTEGEYNLAKLYCESNDIPLSDYIRQLIKIHLKLSESFKVFYCNADHEIKKYIKKSKEK